MCLGNNFLTPKAKVSRAKINNGGCIKLKGFGTAKKAMKLKRQSTKWEKIFPNHISDKGLIFKIYELITAKKKKSNPVRKWAKDLNIYFSKEYIQMANRP